MRHLKQPGLFVPCFKLFEWSSKLDGMGAARRRSLGDGPEKQLFGVTKRRQLQCDVATIRCPQQVLSDCPCLVTIASVGSLAYVPYLSMTVPIYPVALGLG